MREEHHAAPSGPWAPCEALQVNVRLTLSYPRNSYAIDWPSMARRPPVGMRTTSAADMERKEVMSLKQETVPKAPDKPPDPPDLTGILAPRLGVVGLAGHTKPRE
jgi:hypothetical protein